MKKGVIGATLVVMCIGTVFAVNKVKPKACSTSSGISASKNYNKNNKMNKNDKYKDKKDNKHKDKDNICVTKKPCATKKPVVNEGSNQGSTGDGGTEGVNKDGLELVKPGENIGTDNGTGDVGGTGTGSESEDGTVANKDGLELVKPGETSSESTGSGGCSVNVGSKTEDKYMKYQKGTVSHICYFYIDKHGNVKYASKDDAAGNKTSVKLPCKKGYILAIFVKQSTSGMIWFQNKVSDDVVKKVVTEVKKCDKSYKKHEAVVFGDGEHKLNYTTNGGKKHSVCYSFCK